jgi:hypothetical protein
LLDVGRVDARPRAQFAQSRAEDAGRVETGEPSTALADGRPDGFDDHSFRHAANL